MYPDRNVDAGPQPDVLVVLCVQNESRDAASSGGLQYGGVGYQDLRAAALSFAQHGTENFPEEKIRSSRVQEDTDYEVLCTPMGGAHQTVSRGP